MADVENLTYEQAFGELEKTVQRLEAGGLTLEESLRLLERGQAMAKCCNEHLDKAKLRIEKITPEGDVSLELEP